MKKFTLFLFILVSQLSLAQSVTREFDFNDTLHHPMGFIGVCRLYNGDLLASVDVKDTTPFPYDTTWVRLMRMDANANVIWSKTFNLRKTYSRSVSADSSGCYFANWGNGFYCSLVHTDTAVNTIWMRHITNSPTGFSTDINLCHAAPTGGCFVAGSHISQLHNDDLLWAIKYDGQGNVNWSKNIAMANYDINPANTGMEITNNSSVVFPFRIAQQDSSGINFSSCGLIKLDSSGNTVWVHSFADTVSIEPYGIKMLPDSGFIISGVAYAAAGYDIAFLLRTDKDGNQLWYENFDQQFLPMYPNNRQGLAVMNNGNILFGFTNAVTPVWYNAELIECDLSGQLVSSNGIGGYPLDTIAITGLIPSNGNIIAFGSRKTAALTNTQHVPYYHPVLIDFNLPGNTICEKASVPVTTSFSTLTVTSPALTSAAGPSSFFMTPVAIQASPYYTHNCLLNDIEAPQDENAVSVYPNPSSGDVTVDLHLLKGNSSRVLVYDINGKLVEDRTVQNHSGFLFERNSKTDGMYFICVMNENEIVFKGKIILTEGSR
jgi:hypothetical protein